MEVSLGLLGSLGILIALVYSVLQWFGGRSVHVLGIRNRTWARWIAPLFFALSVCGLAVVAGNFSWWMMFSLLAYKLSTHIGYGAATTLGKITRRSLWSIQRTACSLTFAVLTGSWTIYISQVIVGLAVAVIWGVRNPVVAPQEEGVINFSNVFLTPFMVL